MKILCGRWEHDSEQLSTSSRYSTSCKVYYRWLDISPSLSLRLHLFWIYGQHDAWTQGRAGCLHVSGSLPLPCATARHWHCVESVLRVNDFILIFPLNESLLLSQQAPRLAPEIEFVKALIKIGRNLTRSPKDGRTVRLAADLGVINLNLPARVWLPLYCATPHHVVRIPPHAAAVLNSKDKVCWANSLCNYWYLSLTWTV